MQCDKSSAPKSPDEQGNRFAFDSVLPYYNIVEPEYAKTVPLLFEKLILRTYTHCKLNGFASRNEGFTALSVIHIRLKKPALFRDSSSSEEEPTRIKKISITSFTHTQYLHVANYAHNYPTIRVKWTFSLFRNGKLIKEDYTLVKKDMKPLHNLIPIPYLDGDEYEYHELRFNNRNDESVYSAEYWDTWKETGEDMVWHFDNVLYPCFLRAIEKVQGIMQKELTILELGAGDCKLACQLLVCSCTTKHAISKYYAVDNNEGSLQKANEVLNWTDRLTLHSEDLTTVDCNSFLSEKVDVIILCSIVAYTILPKSKSIDLLQRCKQWLSPGGVILITSYASPYFDKKHYKKLGFEVLNTSVPISDPKSFAVFKPFYVLRQPADRENTLKG